jgi:hypothetical protein
VTRTCDPERLRGALDEALPPGLDVVEVAEARTPAFAERLEASLWRVELPGVEPATAAEALAAFLAAPRVEVQRLTKTGVRTFDARSAVIRAEVLHQVADDVPGAGPQAQGGPCAILEMVVRHTTPAVRPDDVLAGLRSHAQLAPPSSPRMTRLAQGPLDEEGGTVADPLAADRDADGA